MLRHKAELPEGKPWYFGDYTIVLQEDAAYICGTKITEFLHEPIDAIEIWPCNYAKIMSDDPNHFEIWDIHPGEAYIYLGYLGMSFLFKNLHDALAFASGIIQIKSIGLTDASN